MEKSRLLVLNAIKYGDNARIVRTFTYHEGLRAYMVHSLKGKGAGAFRPSMLMPLTELEVVPDPRAKGDLGRLKEVRFTTHRTHILENPILLTVATFAAEVLSKVVAEHHPDKGLYTDVLDWLDDLDQDRLPLSTAAHRLLLRVADKLGCYPDFNTYREGCLFDQIDGVFIQSHPEHSHWMDADESRALYTIATDAKASIPKGLRTSVLEELLQFIRIHHEPFGTLKSLDIIRTVLA